MTVEQDLRTETEKWLKKAVEKRKATELAEGRRADYLRNLDAYISDSLYFLKKGDLIRAFEAVIWSWAIIELGLQEGILKSKTSKD